MFKLFLIISGVGFKVVLLLLFISRVNNLKYVIMIGDEKYICRGVGIGKKIVVRIILEFKDKLKLDELLDNVGEGGILDNENIMVLLEVLSVLIVFGYSEKEFEIVFKIVNKDDIVENIIKVLLKVLMG